MVFVPGIKVGSASFDSCEVSDEPNVCTATAIRPEVLDAMTEHADLRERRLEPVPVLERSPLALGPRASNARRRTRHDDGPARQSCILGEEGEESWDL